MKLNIIGEGYWSTISNFLNYNFNKEKLELLMSIIKEYLLMRQS